MDGQIRNSWKLGLVMLAAAALSCSLPTNLIPSTSLGGGTSGPSSGASSGPVLFQDDFENTSSGWEVGTYDTGSVGYQAGKYAVVSLGNGGTMWGTSNQAFSDVDMEVDAAQVSGPDNNNNGYGLMCRAQDNGDGYYLLISGDGLSSILISENDNYTSLVDWQDTSAVKQGNASNHLRAVCNGDELTLYVNGQKVADVHDSTYTHGDVALTATSYETDSTEVHFDNLVVRSP
jgi:3-keto-disaccharide hydrolase